MSAHAPLLDVADLEPQRRLQQQGRQQVPVASMTRAVQVVVAGHKSEWTWCESYFDSSTDSDNPVYEGYHLGALY